MILHLSSKKIPAEDKGSSVWIRGTELVWQVACIQVFSGFDILLTATTAFLSLSPLRFPKEAYFHLSKYSAPVFIFTHERSTLCQKHAMVAVLWGCCSNRFTRLTCLSGISLYYTANFFLRMWLFQDWSYCCDMTTFGTVHAWHGISLLAPYKMT